MSGSDHPRSEDDRPVLGLHPSRSLSAGLLLSVLFPVAVALPRYLSGGRTGGTRLFAWVWGGTLLLVTLALLTVGVTRALAWQFFPDRWPGLGAPRRLGAYVLGIVPAVLLFGAAAEVGVLLFGAAAEVGVLPQP